MCNSYGSLTVLDGVARAVDSLPGLELWCCHGDAPTLADICLVPQIFNAQRFAARR